MVARRTVGGLRWLDAAALVTAAGVVSYALATGSARRHYDVDEIQHTHVIWRIAVGDRPFHDFVESHPPFVWYLGAPLLRWTSGPASAIAGFRILAAGSGLVFVGLVLAAARARQPALSIPWLMTGGLLVLGERRNLDYFIEARPDSLAYALLFAAFVLFLRGHPARLFARYAVFAGLASTALLWTPKFAVLVVAFALADLVARRRQPREVLVAVAGHAAGIVLALAGALAFLAAAAIDPRLAYDLSIGFHGRFLSTTSFRHGLMDSLTEEPVPLGLACAGAVTWAVLALTKHIRPASFELAAFFFLVTAPLLVRLPYKQYYAPWFVLSAIFVPFLGVALRAAGASLARIALVGVLTFTSVAGARAGREYGRVDQVAFFRTLWTLMRNAASPEGRVVADPQWHPIYRRDVFYGWFSTYDPRGRGQEVILREWNPRGYGARFTDEGYASEIAAHPPALIVTVGGGFNLPATQENVVARYVRDHGAEYVTVPLAGKLGLLVRREQANWDYLEAARLARRIEARAGVAASGTTAYHDDFAWATPGAPAERERTRER
jgi:hypothetical protein